MRIKHLAGLLLKYGLLLVTLGITAGLAAVVTMRSMLAAQEVDVPNLTGHGIAEAGALASRERLLLRVEGRRHDPSVPPGSIVAQDPGAGSTLKTGRSVRIWLSLGPENLTVPPIEGESLRAARLSLAQARVPLSRVVEVAHSEGPGTVIQQHPPAGEMQGAGGVSLLVSRGPGGSDYLMPDLIGRPGEDVLEALRLSGWKIAGVRYRAYPGVAPGIVLRQSPASGHRVNAETPIALEISQGEP